MTFSKLRLVSVFGLLAAVAVLMTASACGGSSSTTAASSSTGTSGTGGSGTGTGGTTGTTGTTGATALSTTCGSSASNCVALTVNNGPSSAGYVNGAFTDVTVCASASTSSCATITGVLVDTGSYGLRVLKSALTNYSSLPLSSASTGTTLVECAPFIDSYTWGPVVSGMVTVGGETTTSSIPIQVIDDSSTPTYPVPTACSTPNGTVVPPANNLNELGANAILGVGGLKFDCGDTICPAADDFYYSCPSSGACTAVSVSGSSQVTNPVALFADNNGIAISLPSPASTGSPSLSGAMYFGIGTQTNNTLPSTASVLTLDSTYEAFITTSYKGTSNSTSFIDSGSNGYFFVDSTIPDCINTTSEPYMSDWFCPGSTLSLSATNTGANGTTNTVSFSVANTNTLFNNTTATAYSNLAGTGQTGSFDWGLPFFYGRTVYTAMQGTTSTDTSGVSHAGPFFAY